MSSSAQVPTYEQKFPETKATVENALKRLQPFASGRLPTLDGFAAPVSRPLERFQRGYYQCTVQVISTSSGESLVRVGAKITAWYADPEPSKSGYQVLPSNGRLESDFLDRLREALGSKELTSSATARATHANSENRTNLPTISAPAPQDTVPGKPIVGARTADPSASSPLKLGTPATEDEIASLATQRAVADKHIEELTKEAKNLEEILRNQAHPNNLAAVKKSGTPVLTSPSEGAKVLFTATAHDEFEILDMNASWVHVRISGLSRGWIRRSAVEVPGSPESPAEPAQSAASSSPATKGPAFQIENEQMASFPGTWAPLRGKTVKIISVQKTAATGTGLQAKLEFAKSLFDREYAELSQSPTTAAGVVLVFDSEDGGMMATTLPILQEWKAGSLSDEALWRRCYFDPPEMFTSSPPR